MVLAGTDGPIVTQIRSLLMPQPMQELRVKNAYVEYKKIKGTQGKEYLLNGLSYFLQIETHVRILNDAYSRDPNGLFVPEIKAVL